MGRSRYSASQNTGYNCFRVFGSLADATIILTNLMYSLVLLGPSSSLATILATSSFIGSLSTADKGKSPSVGRSHLSKQHLHVSYVDEASGLRVRVFM